MLFYLVTYYLMNIGAFLVVMIVANSTGREDIEGFRGLAWRGGAVPAVAMAIFLFSLAGLPPLAGFIGKFYLFAAVVKEQFYFLALVGLASTAWSRSTTTRASCGRCSSTCRPATRASSSLDCHNALPPLLPRAADARPRRLLGAGDRPRRPLGALLPRLNGRYRPAVVIRRRIIAGRGRTRVVPAAGVRDDASMPAGVLYLVATPIGNLEDLTARAARILAAVDLIAAEDTRRTARLLHHLGIRRPLRSYYDAVERSRAPALIGELQDGKSIALVSDAGTPGIADPGYRLVQEAIAADIRVVPVPGASAITAFLPASGLATDRFAFEGFLPVKHAARRRRLAALAGDGRTLLFYEAGRRLAATLADMADAFGARRAAIGRELTKLHEEIIRDDLVSLAGRAESLTTKGEVVIGVAGADDAARPADAGASMDVAAPAGGAASRDVALGGDAALAAEIRRRRASGESVRDIAAALAGELGLSRRSLYRLALALER